MNFGSTITGITAPSTRVSRSSSVNYDYSGVDEARKRRDSIADSAAQRYEQLYGGDVSGSVTSGHKIRRLIASLNELPGVRIDSVSSNASVDNDGGRMTFDETEPPLSNYSPMASQTPARTNAIVKNRNKRLAGNVLGDVIDFGGMA
jgi:hypothetical protein